MSAQWHYRASACGSLVRFFNRLRVAALLGTTVIHPMTTARITTLDQCSWKLLNYEKLGGSPFWCFI